MTAQQTPDRDQWRKAALGQLGLITADPRWPGRVLILLDQLDQADADVKRLSWQNGHLIDKHNTDMEELRREVDQAEARLQAVRDVLTHRARPTDRIGDLPTAIRRALNG